MMEEATPNQLEQPDARTPADPGGSSPPSVILPPMRSWPIWTGPAALVCGFILAAFASLLVDIPALLFGVKIDSSKLPPGLVIADTAVQDAVFVFVAYFFARVGSRTVQSWQFGLRPTGLWRAVGLIALTLVGFIIFSVLWAALMQVSTKEKLLDQLGANHNAALLVSSAVLTTVFAPIGEEVLFRGYVFQALRNWRGPFSAALLTGLLFGAFHLGSAPIVDLVPLAVLGFGLCLLYWRTGSLYACVVAHSLNNSLAYGDLESWAWWQVILLMITALLIIGALVLSLRRLGVIKSSYRPAAVS